MSGPAHYETAELMLAQAAALAQAEELDENEAAALDYLLDAATVHVQLAQVAATVLAAPGRMTADSWRAWQEVLE